jgi:protein required for attachment to host cells
VLPEESMRIRVVVASQGEVCLYDLGSRTGRLKLAARWSDPLAHLHDRDFKSDRPGRVFDHASGAGRRGATAHHGTGGERRPRRHEAELFARRVAEQLTEASRKGEFDRLVLMAPPAFLGLLRKAIPGSMRDQVAAEVRKDLMHQSPAVVLAHVPPEALRGQSVLT